jgi:tetratricopeptide (TPR) repeat protein
MGAIALLIVGGLWHPLAPACVAGSGALLTVAAARRDRFLLAAALGGFTLRAVLAGIFHWVAALDIPRLQPLLQSEPISGHRFWIVARDSLWYHVSAVESLIAWTHGTELPEGSDPQYFIFVAIIYRLFGANPLNAVLWNALFGALTVVAGYRIALRVAGPAGARATAVLIACWPSAVLWSTQLLKDAICLWLILVLLYLTMRAVEPPLPAASPGWAVARWMALLVLVFATALAVHRFRYYVLLILIPAPAVFVVHALIRPTRRTPWRIAATCVVMGVMVLAVSASRRIDLNHLFGSRYPAIGHVNVGVQHQSRGDLAVAQAHYERALALVKDHPPALKNLAAVALARGEGSKAIDYLQRYVAREPRDEEARVALDALVRPVVETVTPRPVPSQSAVKPPLLLAPAPIPVPSEPLAITGPGSDYAMGKRTSEYGDPFTAIARLRRGFARTGGHSAIDADVEYKGYRDVLRYLPRALANVLFAPYPSQWFDRHGSTGSFKVLSAMEAVLLYVLIIPLVIGLGIVVGRGSPDALYLAVFVTTMMVLLGLVVSNVGTLFRLRLESLLPLFTAGGLGCAWLVHRRR